MLVCVGLGLGVLCIVFELSDEQSSLQVHLGPSDSVRPHEACPELALFLDTSGIPRSSLPQKKTRSVQAHIASLSARRTENIDRYLAHMLVLIRRDIMRVLTLFLDRHPLLPTSLSDFQEELSVNGSNAAPLASSMDSSLAPNVPSSSDDP
jgi:hypothetical protein